MKTAPYSSYFPEGSNKKTVAALQSLVKQCAKAYKLTQKAFRFPTLRLSEEDRTRLAEILIDFALDIHSGSGLWTALEKYNTELFGTPLPLVHDGKAKLPTGICVERVQFLLWNMYPQIDRGRFLAPDHHDLLIAAEQVTEFLTESLPSLPDVSPVKKFLDMPKDYGWEIKRKLIWLGTKSYMFRLLFEEYIEEKHNGEISIGIIDDFICQNTSIWSGLGANDILADCLDVPEAQREELRNWYLRHVALYEIIKTGKEHSEAINLINDAPYRIREGAPGHPRSAGIRQNMILYGSLVPWRGEWYWSGECQNFTPLTARQRADVIKNVRQKTQFVARYCKEREEKVFQFAEEQYQQSVKFYGNDLVVFPNGRAWQREEKKRFAAWAKAHGHAGHMPNMSWSEDLLESDNGIGIFSHPVEGQEIMEEFNEVRNGLKKDGKGCTGYEGEIIREWICSTSINPHFIHRVLREYGGEESIKSAFCWSTDASYWLDYLLRCRKGEYYRRRFPSIDIVDTKGN